MIKPLHNRIVVKPIPRSLSSVLIVENREAFNRGEVLSVGPEVTEVRPGQRIAYGNGDYLKWDLINLGDQKVQIIQEADVVGIEAA